MTYPGQRVQVDVKYVPMKCMTKELKEQGERYYQYTAIDEYTRLRVLWFAKEHSTYESSKFVEVILKKFPFKVEEIQTDNGFEFTNRLSYNTSYKWLKFKNHVIGIFRSVMTRKCDICLTNLRPTYYFFFDNY
ncbi:MAG: transposase family protein [Clostridia bacterium]|nr:transposase family protein [Clostridia bacterium]